MRETARDTPYETPLDLSQRLPFAATGGLPTSTVLVVTHWAPLLRTDHALAGDLHAAAFALVGTALLRARWARAFAYAAAALLALAVGFSRLALGVHYFSDVLGGWLIGLCWTFLVAAALGRHSTRSPLRRGGDVA